MGGSLILGGCVAPYGERVEPVALERDRSLGPDAAFVVPASGGPAVLGVIERTYRNAVRQKIVLQNDGSVSGENTIEVTFYGPLKATPDAGNLKRDTGTLRDIGIEMRRKIPVAMAIAPDFAQNTLGPFGFALGGNTRTGRCIYAWQRIHAQRNVFLEPSSRGEISLRLRYCARQLSDDGLLDLMYGIAIVATLPNRNWNPFGTPPPADPAIGARGEVIRPVLATPPAQPAPAPSTTRRPASPPADARAATGAAPRAPAGTVRTSPPGRLPTPVAEPALVRPTAPMTISPPLEMPPALGAAPPGPQGSAAPSGLPPAPAVPAAPAAPPVRQVGPAVGAQPPGSRSAVPAAPAVQPRQGSAPATPAPPAPVAPRVAP